MSLILAFRQRVREREIESEIERERKKKRDGDTEKGGENEGGNVGGKGLEEKKRRVQFMQNHSLSHFSNTSNQC